MVELVPAKQHDANGRTMEVFCFISFPRISNKKILYALEFSLRIIFIINFFWEQIMTPKARGDVHINLPALQKLDSMLIVGGIFISIKPQ